MSFIAPITVGVDPFLITGPAVISFSGGRTSAYMLWRILQAHGGQLPDDVVVCFANTGEESEATYQFIHECSLRWSVPIAWLEYRHAYITSNWRRTRWTEVVKFQTASRKGEPFDMMLESKGIVPDRSRRFCTEQLKVLTINRHVVKNLGWKGSVMRVIGFRGDESVRVDNWRAGQAAMPKPDVGIFPLALAGIQALDILAFWRRQPFRLELDKDGDGGNCGSMCFMMSAEQIGRMCRKDPERAERWIARERRNGRGVKLMAPGRSYASVRETALRQGVLDWDDMAPCDQACGV